MLIPSLESTHQPILLTGKDLNIDEVALVAYHHVKVTLDGEAMKRVNSERSIVEQVTHQDVPIYGITTGVGANKNVKIPENLITEFQNRILLSHCIGVGPYYSEEIVRAIMLCRANSLAKGGTGVQPKILKMHIDLLNSGVHPLVPSRGSIGAADLGPLAELGLVFIGQGEVTYQGQKMSTSEALYKAGIEPLELGPKDGLVLCSHNSLSIGHGALVLKRCASLLELANLSYALSLEGFRGNVSPLNPKTNLLRPHPGQTACLKDLLLYLKGSFLWEPGSQRSVQDPISYRSALQVNGACRDILEFALDGMEIELNSVGDNPLILADEDNLISHHGNFHIETLAMRYDFLGIQLSSLANMIQNRIQRLMTPEFSDLPKFLTMDPGLSNGFSTLQKTYTALAAEIRHLANPGSLDALPVANGIEDHASMAPFVVQKTERILENLEYMIGIECMVAAQAIDLLEHPKLGKGTEATYQCIRQVIPKLEKDRILSIDIENARALVSSGKLLETAKKALIK